MASGSADVVKRVFIEFEASGAADVKRESKGVEDGLRNVGKAGEEALGGGQSGRPGLRGLLDKAKGAWVDLWAKLNSLSLKNLGSSIAAVGGLFGQFGLAVAGVKAAIELARDAQMRYNDTIELVPDLLYRMRQNLGQTSNEFGEFARRIEADAARAGRAVAPLFALGQASADQATRAQLDTLLRAGGGFGGGVLADAAALVPKRAQAAATAARGGGGGGGGAPAVDPMQAIAGIDFGSRFAGFGSELRASGDAYINAKFAGGADQTLATKAAEIQAALAATEQSFATATTAAQGLGEVQAATLNTEQTEAWADITTGALENVGRSMASAVVQSVLLGKGLQSVAKTALVGATVQAATEAAFQTGKGFALLAAGRPEAATMAFTSAKAFAAVGAIAGVGAATLGGFSGGGGGGARASGGAQSGIGDTARSATGGGPTEVTVYVGISRGQVHDAVVEESNARGTRRGVPRVAMA